MAKSKVRKPKSLKKDGTINAHWTKFKIRLENYSDTPIANWKPENVLGYILKTYKDKFGIEYTLSLSGAPSRCPEMYCVKRMLAILNCTDHEITKLYIDWVIKSVDSIKSLALFFHRNMVDRFKNDHRDMFRSTIIARSTVLPNHYLSVAQEFDVAVSTYGDLAFAKMAVDNNPGNYPNYALCLRKIQEMGFNLSVLETLD